MPKPLFKSNGSECTVLKHALKNRVTMGFNETSQAYLFTNENHADLFRLLDTHDKDILTACSGSGDFLFNAKFFGANHIDQFDISLFTKYAFEIKYQAISHLDYYEFRRMFYCSKTFLNKDDSGKIMPHLSKPAAYLLQKSMETKSHAMWIFRIWDIEKPLENSYPNRSPYLASKQEYNIVQERLSTNTNFYTKPLHGLTQCLTRSYDIIYLSNISQYSPSILSFDINVIKPLAHYLKPGGKIVCYQINGSLTSWSESELQNSFCKSNEWKSTTNSIPNIYARTQDSERKDSFFILEKTR